MMTYNRNEIQHVYKRHQEDPNSVVYSEDGGSTWQSAPIDSGKWKHNWLFSFIEKEIKKVKCVYTNVEHASITQGDVYKVLHHHNGMYCFIDDNDELVTVHNSYFVDGK